MNELPRASFYCPLNSASPVPVAIGFMAVGSPSPFEPSVTVYAEKQRCPIGSFCSEGRRISCYVGSYGKMPLATLPAHCSKCEAGKYIAESGRFSSVSSDNSCLPCPRGSAAPDAGRAFCGLCQPVTFRGTGSTGCMPCAAGSTSLFGAEACFSLLSNDVLSMAPGAVAFQRLISVTDGNLPTIALVKRTIIPITFVFCVPYILIAIAFLCSWRRFSKALVVLKKRAVTHASFPLHSEERSFCS